MIIFGFVVLFGSAFGTVSILRPLLTREILGQRNFGAKSGVLAMFSNRLSPSTVPWFSPVEYWWL